MKKIFSCVFLFVIFGSFNCKIKNSKNSNLQINSNKRFEQDFLKIFPNFDFSDTDLYSIIAFFKVSVGYNHFNKVFNKLDELQSKYSNEFEILQRILFFKFILCYVFNNPQKYSETNLQYSKIVDKNFTHYKSITKINYLFRDIYYSNYSDYCIGMKQKDYALLRETGSTDEYIDLLSELMILSKELLFLNFLIQVLDSSYGMSWVESLWYSSDLIRNYESKNLDVYYYHLIEFFCSQGLKEKAWPLYQEFCHKCPHSNLIELVKAFF